MNVFACKYGLHIGEDVDFRSDSVAGQVKMTTYSEYQTSNLAALSTIQAILDGRLRCLLLSFDDFVYFVTSPFGRLPLASVPFILAARVSGVASGEKVVVVKLAIEELSITMIATIHMWISGLAGNDALSFAPTIAA